MLPKDYIFHDAKGYVKKRLEICRLYHNNQIDRAERARREERLYADLCRHCLDVCQDRTAAEKMIDETLQEYYNVHSYLYES